MTETTKFLGKLRSSRLHKIIVVFEPWGVLFAVLGLLFTVVEFHIEHEYRVMEHIVNARAVVTTSASVDNNEKWALEYLNKEDGFFCNWFWEGCVIFLKERVSLAGINLSASTKNSRTSPQKVNLPGVDLSEANLPLADLEGAILSGASLAYASLDGAKLFNASLVGTRLVGASLVGADLSYAKLDGANVAHASLDGAKLFKASLVGADVIDTSLNEADLSRADLTGADFSRSSGLSQGQLDKACADQNRPPVLPNGLVWRGKVCPLIPDIPS